MPAKRSFLVTGVSGFIGRHVATELLDQGHDVVALSRSGRGNDRRIRMLRCDLLSSVDLRPVMEAARADTLLHLAWETRHGYYWEAPENLQWLAASALLIKAFREAGGRRVVVAGTCAEYDAPADAICDAVFTPCIPRHLYSAAKDSLRRSIEVYARRADLSFSWARVFHLIGPDEATARLVPSAIRAFSEGRSFETRSADKRLDIMDVRDCGRGFAAIAASNLEGPVNIGSGTLVSIGEIMQELAGLMGRPDLLVSRPGSDPREGLSDRCAGLTELRKLSAFKPFYTLREALLAAIASNTDLATNRDKQ